MPNTILLTNNIVHAISDVDFSINNELGETINLIPRVGRNNRCPCGSGMKYKHCHGKYP